MRRTDPRSAAAWWLLAAPVLLVPGAVAADWPWSWTAPRDPRMAAIIAAVRAEEAKYKDIAYVARITVRDSQRKDPANPAEVTTLATRRVVLEGDRISFRYRAFERVGTVKYRHEETSAYDGERTVTVIAGNCANIQLGRWQHPAIAPAHSLPLLHYSVNFPLSVYLGGTEAIHAHLKYLAGQAESGAANVFRKIEAGLEGEERLEGVRCLKVRVHRWFQPNAPPLTQYLWLAPERNYHCVKEEYLWNKMRLHEMRVHELREAAPGVWFPSRITVDEFNPNARIQGKEVLKRTETTFEEIDLAPRHEAAFFRDAAIPAGLPVFTIKDRRLVGSMLPDPFDDDCGKRKLAGLAARVAEQEKGYDNLEVKARTITKYPRSLSAQNVQYDEMSEECSIVRNGLAYSTARQKIAFPGDWQDASFRVNAYDGQWTRFFWGQGPRDHPQGFGVTLRRGSTKGGGGISVHRPHTLMLRQNWALGSLSGMLASGPHEPSGQMPFRFRYCGAAEVDGHPCIEVRGDNAHGRFNQNNSLVLYLATDRNDIPVKMEQYGNYLGNRLMPISVGRCGDLREIAPGRWYPFRVTEFGFDIWAQINYGWLVLNWRRDTTIESVSPASHASEAVFRDVAVPAAANVQVIDEDGNYVNGFQQAEAGVPTLALKRYLELVSDARMNPRQMQARGRAFDALIGKPAAEFPAGATWLSGRPLTLQAMRGQVVVIGFWAEWNDACRDDLVRLEQLHQDRARSGLAVVGVHPLGSEPAEIKKVIDALHLEFPICVDAPGPERTSAWGEFFGRFAVRSVPHAVVVNREGTIVAYGRLADVLAKTRALVQKGR